MRTTLVLIFGLLLSFCLIYFARPISGFLVDRFSRGPRIEITPVAEVVKSDGGGFVRTLETAKFVPIKPGLPLFAKDEIKTEKSGRIHIKMSSGYEIELLPESQLIIDMWAAKTGPEYFSLTRGSFRVLVQGKKGELYILQNSHPYVPEEAPAHQDQSRSILVQSGSAFSPTPAQRGVSILPTGAPTPVNSVGGKMPEKKNGGEEATLSSAYIETILGNQAPLFRRCQLSSLRDGAVSTGNLTLAFTIANDGATFGVRVVSSSLKNKELEKCALNVIERTKFKSYVSSEVQLSYPIEFR